MNFVAASISKYHEAPKRGPVSDESTLKIRTRMLHQMGKAIDKYRMIEPGDRIMIGLSGGKDSLTLTHLLADLQRRAPVRFELLACTIHSGAASFDTTPIGPWLKEQGVAWHLEPTNIDRLLREHMTKPKAPCSFCARLRRGVLYRVAKEKGCNKIALGHHADDFIETLLLNLFFGGGVKAMAPVLHADDGINQVIRPLVFSWEKDTALFSRKMAMPVICCGCPACGLMASERKRVKKLLSDLSVEYPHLKANFLRSLQRVVPSHLLDVETLRPPE